MTTTFSHNLKHLLDGRIFQSNEEVIDAVNNCFRELDKYNTDMINLLIFLNIMLRKKKKKNKNENVFFSVELGTFQSTLVHGSSFYCPEIENYLESQLKIRI